LLDAALDGKLRFNVPARTALEPPLATMPDENSSFPVASFLSGFVKSKILILQDFFLLTFQSIVNIFTPPLYWADALEQMDLIGVGSMPIVVISAVFIGGVLVVNTASQLERFGMAALTGDGVALALVRELGPTITALLVAGRNASGIASELGSMIVTEQVDAMRALGTDPIRKLMTPRVVATLTMVPLLTAMADFSGLIGGSIVAYFTLGVGTIQFWTRAIRALDFGDLSQGLMKPVVFALIIATVGCFQGLRVKGGTQGVGRATTSAVVVSSVTIIITDLFITKLALFLFK
jgi:phospholipid/cholesterol/gamma-HCH transport system permease protein